ncbi:MAG: DUF4038 domain-containing protein [Anaerolineae bacterium]|nr:DUF4038 domain-containing protein [Anaerolineae bacterium]
MVTVAQWTVIEIAFESAVAYADPFWDVDLEVTFTGPSGQTQVVDAFWDGGNTWRVRFAPEAVGTWTWRSSCSDDACTNYRTDSGLHEQVGTFDCGPYDGENPLYQRGVLRVSGDGHFLRWAEGEPFFWLADTAWNGVLRAEDEDWERYLSTRADQGFTVIQFVSTQWRGATEVLGAQRAFTGDSHITLNPGFFQARDAKVATINEHGLVAAPVVLWALWESDPGQALPEEDAIRLARYIVARWGAYHVVWFLGGDGNYTGERAERWRRIGRAVFGEERHHRGDKHHRGDRHSRLVTMHPCGQTWVGQEFRGEPWFDFIGYQSGHGSSEEHLRWLVQGPPASDWATEPVLPVINLEPNYENHPSYHIARRFTDAEVRRAAYWSCLVAPTAGVSYGTNPIWVWAESAEVPEGHDRIGPVAAWTEGLDLPGIHSMTELHAFFEQLPWWTLRPAQEVLAEQPGEEAPEAFIAAARSESDDLVILYAPDNEAVSLVVDRLPPDPVICWFDPHLGKWTDFCSLPDDGDRHHRIGVLLTPRRGDWLLVIKSGAHSQ